MVVHWKRYLLTLGRRRVDVPLRLTRLHEERISSFFDFGGGCREHMYTCP